MNRTEQASVMADKTVYEQHKKRRVAKWQSACLCLI